MVQGPTRPPGQLGQDGRDGQDGQIPQLPRGMINVPGVASAPLDTSGLENFFENLGRTMVDMTEQRTYDSMFVVIPIYHGNDDEDFDEWADQLEALCEISQQNIHHEMMGRSSAAVKKIIRSIDPN